LSSAAILAVYAAGYFNTSAVETPSAALVQGISTSVVAEAGSAAPQPPGTAGAGSIASAAATATPSAGKSPIAAGTATTGYADGSYTATGTSRHGSIGVTVVVQSGKVVSADITTCQTKYPCSKVISLPGQVLTRQSAAVNYVSGSTDSSKAYASAVAQALAKAAA